VGSWSQLKQNVPVFWCGTALKHFEDTGQWGEVQDLYISLFFKTLFRNSMMSLKILFPYSIHEKRPRIWCFWQII
jgi:phosphoenolpyruvate carboxylase